MENQLQAEERPGAYTHALEEVLSQRGLPFAMHIASMGAIRDQDDDAPAHVSEESAAFILKNLDNWAAVDFTDALIEARILGIDVADKPPLPEARAAFYRMIESLDILAFTRETADKLFSGAAFGGVMLEQEAENLPDSLSHQKIINTIFSNAELGIASPTSTTASLQAAYRYPVAGSKERSFRLWQHVIDEELAKPDTGEAGHCLESAMGRANDPAIRNRAIEIFNENYNRFPNPTAIKQGAVFMAFDSPAEMQQKLNGDAMPTMADHFQNIVVVDKDLNNELASRIEKLEEIARARRANNEQAKTGFRSLFQFAVQWLRRNEGPSN